MGFKCFMISFFFFFVLLISLAIRGISCLLGFHKNVKCGFYPMTIMTLFCYCSRIYTFMPLNAKKPPLLRIYGFSTIVPQFRLPSHGKNVSAWNYFLLLYHLHRVSHDWWGKEWKRKGRSEKLLQIKWGLLHIPLFSFSVAKELSMWGGKLMWKGRKVFKYWFDIICHTKKVLFHTNWDYLFQFLSFYRTCQGMELIWYF